MSRFRIRQAPICLAVLVALGACTSKAEQREALWAPPPASEQTPSWKAERDGLQRDARVYFADEGATAIPHGMTVDGRQCGLVKTKWGRFVVLRKGASFDIASEQDPDLFTPYVSTLCVRLGSAGLANTRPLPIQAVTTVGEEADNHFQSISAQNAAVENTRQTHERAKVVAMHDIRAHLRDPESAEFSDLHSGSDGAVCGVVNAKNGFGGRSVTRFVTVGGAQAMEDADKQVFLRLWKKYCH